MGPVNRDRRSAAAGWLAFLFLLVTTHSVQPLGSTPGTAAECRLYVRGGVNRILSAGMRCTGPQPTIALALPYMEGRTANFSGVGIASSCASDANSSSCLVSICAGRLMLRNSSVSGVRGMPLNAVLCVMGGSRVEVQGGSLSLNLVTPLAVLDQAHLLMNGSVVSNNSVNGSGGGLWLEGRANVTITGRSRVQGNNSTADGGGVVAWDHVVLRVDGNSSLHGNSADDDGGGLAAFDSVSITLTGGGSVHGNSAEFGGGGLHVSDSATVSLAGGSSVHGNSAEFGGGGLSVMGNATVSLAGGSSVHGNTADFVGGGLSVLDNATVSLAGGSSVHGNRAELLGGGLSVSGNATVSFAGGSSVHGNSAVNGSGGGINVEDGARVHISNQSTVFNNACSGGSGGGISVDVNDNAKFDARGRVVDAGSFFLYAYASYVTISNSTVLNNTSNLHPGGGLALGRNGSIELVDGTVVSKNSAVNSSGGGVVLLGNGTLHADGSVVFVDNSVNRGYVGSTIAAFDNSTLNLTLRGDDLTKCSAGVYLGWSTCEAGQFMQHDVCVCCPPHTFSFTNAPCEPCPGNGKCSGGSLVQPVPGYWSSAPTSVQMHRCPLSTAACSPTGPSTECSEGYMGPLCGACQLPQYGMLGPFQCSKCMARRLQLALYLSMSGVSVLFVTYTVHATWKDNLTGNKVVLATDLIKVLVLYLQYTAIIGSVSVPWPLFDLKRWFQAVNVVFAGTTGQTLSLDCWLFGYIPQGRLPLAVQRQLVYFLAPVFVLLAVVALLWLSWAMGRWLLPLVWQPEKGADQQPAKLIVRKMPVALLVVTFYAYPTLLRASLSFFACLRIDRVPPEVQLPPGATAPLNHTLGYWVSDISQQCFAGYHKAWALGLGLPSTLLWCITVPAAMGVGLFLCRDKADRDSFREHFGFLYRSYRPERMWWEAVWAARTVVLTLVSVFAIPLERYFAVLSLLVVFLVSAVLQNVFQPYAFPTLHRMHMVSTSCLVVTTLGALAMLAYDIQESTALKLRITIAVLVMVVNVVFVGLCLWKLAPAVHGWCMSAMAKSRGLLVQFAARVRTEWPQLRAGQGRGRARRGAAGSCV